MKHTIILPDLGQTTSEVKVVRWLRRPGDRVSEGEPLLEVETDKATMDVEAYVAGYLREIFITEGETVSAMAPIAVLTDDPDESYLKSSTSLSEIPTTRPPSPSESSFEKTDYMRVQAVPAARSLAREHGIDLGSVVGTGPTDKKSLFRQCGC